jgi:hypothetical protein
VSDGDGDLGGSGGVAGSGNAAGIGGSAGGNGGSMVATGASGGSIAGSGGDSGGGGSAGDAGLAFPAPTCDDETADDACIQCLKASCCEAWLGCNDESCVSEVVAMSACMQDVDFPDDVTYGECLSASSSAMDAFVQENTGTVLDCANEMTDSEDPEAGFTNCGIVCFGDDIFFD